MTTIDVDYYEVPFFLGVHPTCAPDLNEATAGANSLLWRGQVTAPRLVIWDADSTHPTPYGLVNGGLSAQEVIEKIVEREEEIPLEKVVEVCQRENRGVAVYHTVTKRAVVLRYRDYDENPVQYTQALDFMKWG